MKLEFYKHVLAAVAAQTLDELSVQKPQYLAEMKQFFRIIIAKFLARDTECRELMDIAASIFDWGRPLHARALPAHASVETERLEYDASLTTKRTEQEMSWRMHELKVGDEVDVVKHTQVRDLTLSAWSRGTVIFKGSPQDEG